MIDDDKIAIKEMAQIICLDKDHRGDCERCCYYDGRSRLRCSSVSDAEKLYAKGYRKQSEGEWLVKWRSTFPQYEPSEYECSNCGYRRTVLHKYCPNCGANMKGGE